jgi:hypothetical protein
MSDFWNTYLSFKQFKLIVKMTRIESGVTVSKGLFTIYGNVKIVTANIFFGRHSTYGRWTNKTGTLKI